MIVYGGHDVPSQTQIAANIEDYARGLQERLEHKTGINVPVAGAMSVACAPIATSAILSLMERYYTIEERDILAGITPAGLQSDDIVALYERGCEFRYASTEERQESGRGPQTMVAVQGQGEVRDGVIASEIPGERFENTTSKFAIRVVNPYLLGYARTSNYILQESDMHMIPNILLRHGSVRELLGTIQVSYRLNDYELWLTNSNPPVAHAVAVLLTASGKTIGLFCNPYERHKDVYQRRRRMATWFLFDSHGRPWRNEEWANRSEYRMNPSFTNYVAIHSLDAIDRLVRYIFNVGSDPVVANVGIYVNANPCIYNQIANANLI